MKIIELDMIKKFVISAVEICPIHHRDAKSQWKTRVRIYLKYPIDRCDALEKCSRSISCTN